VADWQRMQVKTETISHRWTHNRENPFLPGGSAVPQSNLWRPSGEIHNQSRPKSR